MKSLTPAGPAETALDVLSHFRVQFYDCLYKRADALFELADAVLCADGPVTSLAEFTLTAEHRRGHWAMYDAVNHGWLEPRRLRRLLASTPLPRTADGPIVLAVDVSNWLRHDAPTSPDLLFCHVYGRGRSADQFVPGWPYSFVAALETGRTSWTALLDAVRLGPADDATAVTAAQLRDVVTRLLRAGQWKPGDPDILIVMDAGYDVTRLAYVLADLPVELVGRLRSDRVILRDAGPRRSTPRGGQPRKDKTPVVSERSKAALSHRREGDARGSCKSSADPVTCRAVARLGPDGAAGCGLRAADSVTVPGQTGPGTGGPMALLAGSEVGAGSGAAAGGVTSRPREAVCHRRTLHGSPPARPGST